MTFKSTPSVLPVFGAGIWHFATYLDRYATEGYGPPVGLLEQIDLEAFPGDRAAYSALMPASRRIAAQATWHNALAASRDLPESPGSSDAPEMALAAAEVAR